jgi:serine/threonine protein phosphatase PrpC
MNFLTASYTGKGGRIINEDSIYHSQTNNTYIAIVADGLGMHGGGDVASSTVVDTIAKKFFDRASLDSNVIRDYFESANRAVIDKQTSSCKMKSTAAVLLSIDNKMAFAHVGDSRLYYFSNGKLVYQSEDHSVSQMAVTSGEITAGQIRFHEDRNRLLRALGGNDTVRSEIMIPHNSVKNGDAFLLCSDGFWEYVLEGEMEIDLAKADTPEGWITYLLTRIGKRITENNDNLSVIAIFYEE